MTLISSAQPDQSDSGLYVRDLLTDGAFAGRPPRPRAANSRKAAIERLTQILLGPTETILQCFVELAVETCGADSAGISIERPDQGDDRYYEWVATAGLYSPFLDAMLPRFPSACGQCLEHERAQHLRVSKDFFDRIGAVAPVVTDGLLLPWNTGSTRGTIWILAHERSEAFDMEDYALMELFAQFSAVSVARQQQQRVLQRQWAATASSAIADSLSVRIREPLQTLENLVFRASQGKSDGDAKALAKELTPSLTAVIYLIEALSGRSVTNRTN